MTATPNPLSDDSQRSHDRYCACGDYRWCGDYRKHATPDPANPTDPRVDGTVTYAQHQVHLAGPSACPWCVQSDRALAATDAAADTVPRADLVRFLDGTLAAADIAVEQGEWGSQADYLIDAIHAHGWDVRRLPDADQ